jgi:zinc D-Ala-D-Ala carboxypeptidase|tara:strand:- start:130 stop:582 length:453 start_codon:yes stop_codon:yes gene_type:complete
MRLSENFSLWELTKSQVAERKGISNDPGKREIENLRLLCRHVLQPVRDNYGLPVQPSSGYRCTALNKAIGSSSRSQHVTGQAVDFEVPRIDNKVVANWIRDNLVFDQLILEYYKEGDPTSGWVHVSYVEPSVENRKQAQVYDGRTWKPLE